MQGFAPQHIALATDFSAASGEAMRTAILLSDAFGADLTAIYAEELDRAVAHDEAASRLQRWIDSQAPEHPVRGEIASGRPVEALLRAAESAAADLILLGAHPRHGIERFYLGHIAEAVLRASAVPVLIVRRGMRAIHSIVCGVDCTDDSLYALRSSITWGERFRSEVNVVNVIEPTAPQGHVVGELESWIPPELRARCQCKELVIRGGSERLVAFAGSLKADLIVIGGKRTVAGDAPLPDAAGHVVRRARCAVLALIEQPVPATATEPLVAAALSS